VAVHLAWIAAVAHGTATGNYSINFILHVYLYISRTRDADVATICFRFAARTLPDPLMEVYRIGSATGFTSKPEIPRSAPSAMFIAIITFPDPPIAVVITAFFYSDRRNPTHPLPYRLMPGFNLQVT
jgi:hypothetical protein